MLEEGYLTDAEKELRPAWRGGHGFNTDKHKFEGLFPQYTWRNPGWPQLATYPVGNVSWNDATKFCEWLSKKTGKLAPCPSKRSGSMPAGWAPRLVFLPAMTH
ncbi:SUMF1/EgtB/PvdO family nonheme iron enzyme [Spirosoma sp. BT702]|uniref:SUMF1/EgtB/PvdO family nonheme iron enzyme n=1 Tax=Spirosoma profusum TaxID=2771354 RepID=A0A927AVA4_9BACT|nr:SUMF1/EgtB/PvdO family nonheme iron enzyme [Spirosoma profusum]